MPNDPNANLDAIELLKRDHREVESLFEEFEETDDDERKVELARTVCLELMVHAQIEEEIFYPAAREVLEGEQLDMVSEAAVEHQSAKQLIAEINGSGPGDEYFEAKVKVLSEYIKHHVNEEENELMPAVRDKDVDLDALGEQLAERKQKLKRQLEGKSTGRRNARKVQLPAVPGVTSGRRRSAGAKRAKTASRRSTSSRSRGGATTAGRGGARTSRGAAASRSRSTASRPRKTAAKKTRAAAKRGGRSSGARRASRR